MLDMHSQLDDQILIWYPDRLPAEIADVLAAQMWLDRAEVLAIYRKQKRRKRSIYAR